MVHQILFLGFGESRFIFLGFGELRILFLGFKGVSRSIREPPRLLSLG